MKPPISLLSVIPFLLTACASAPPFQYMGNSPPEGTAPTGDHVLLQVTAQKLAPEEARKTVQAAAEAWLKGRGYVLETDPKKAHAQAHMTLRASPRPDVPGTPIGRGIDLQVWLDQHGVAPEKMPFLQIAPENFTVPFYEDPEKLKAAVDGLYAKSVFANVERAPSPKSTQDPGCYYILGVGFDVATANAEKRFVVKGFPPGSTAQAKGIHVGDQLIELDGKPFEDYWDKMKYHEGQNVELTYLHDWKQKKASVTVMLFCLGEGQGAPAASQK